MLILLGSVFAPFVGLSSTYIILKRFLVIYNLANSLISRMGESGPVMILAIIDDKIMRYYM